MHPRLAQGALLAALTVSMAGCRLPGKPGPNFVPQRPDEVTNFHALYSQNCQACHGANGENGTAVSLANPAYIAYAGREHIAAITAQGIGGSLMPAFSQAAGGLLTERQVGILAEGIVSQWGKPAALAGSTPPPYESQAHGNPTNGQALYRQDCLRCHAPGTGSILDPAYLALISDGGLRSLLVAGKPTQGMPDWRGYPGGPLSDQQLADLVSFMASFRTIAPGQPFPNAAGSPNSAQSAAEAAAHAAAQQKAIQAGPATGGPARSSQPVPTATPKHPEALQP